MDNYYIYSIGYLGSFFLTIMFIPQTYSVWKNKSYDCIQYIFLVNALFTSLCLGSYGLYYQKYPIVIGNTSVFVNTMILLYLKYKNNI